jgi:hypothetical protein
VSSYRSPDEHWPAHEDHHIVFNQTTTETRTLAEVCVDSDGIAEPYDSDFYDSYVEDVHGPRCMTCNVELSWDGEQADDEEDLT